MTSSVVRTPRRLTLALALAAALSQAATVGEAQTGGRSSASASQSGAAQTRSATSQPASQSGARRSDSASASESPAAACEGANCESGGTGFSGAVRRLQVALRNVGKGTSEQAGRDFDIPLRFSDLDRFGPFGKLIGTLALFGLGIWGILNPKSILVVVLWGLGFVVAGYGQARGHLIAGVVGACVYWWLLHFVGGRASRRWARRRLRPTVYKPS